MSSRATYPLSQRPVLLVSQLNSNLARLEEIALDMKRKTYQVRGELEITYCKWLSLTPHWLVLNDNAVYFLKSDKDENLFIFY